MNEGLGKTISVLSVSDAFRRHAAFDNPMMVKQLVDASRDLAALLTNYRHERPALAENRDVERRMAARLKMIAAAAHSLGADRVELPVSVKDRRNVALIGKILATLPLTIQFIFQSDVYDRNPAHLGKVDASVPTVLDPGYRGFAATSDAFRFRPENNK